MTLYLDSNIFLYATLNTEAPGNRARSLLQRIRQGEEQAKTSALTLDEILWNVKKHRNLDDAIDAGEAFLNFPHLELAPVTGELVAFALSIIKKYRLNPRDAIHAATAITEKTDYIVSTDPHFDKIKELKRQPL
jgi:predicted nucleic acid-binding protein